MRYMPRQLVSEIREKHSYLSERRTSPEVVLRAERIGRKAIERSARVHSFRIEHPELKVPFSVPRNGHKKSIKEGIRNLCSAFYWGKENFNPRDFQESFIREVAGRVTPELYRGEIAMYRDMGTNITGASFTPPYPEKLVNVEIPRFVRVMQKQLSSEDIINQIEAAIYAHLHIARMHPFVDGNGRTARTLQDVILDRSGFPLPIIEVGERNTYYRIIDRASYDWKHEKNGEEVNGATEGENLFYTFMAGKINVSLDKLIENIQK